MQSTDALPSMQEIEDARARAEEQRLQQGETNGAPGARQELEDTAGAPVDPEPSPYEGAADDPPLLEEDHTGQVALVVDGRHEKLDTKVTGRQPTSSTLAITGGKVEVGGQYQPGDRVSFVVTVVVDAVAFKDEKDPKTQQVVGRARNHKGYIAGIREQ